MKITLNIVNEKYNINEEITLDLSENEYKKIKSLSKKFKLTEEELLAKILIYEYEQENNF